jgi:hypothetical protein
MTYEALTGWHVTSSISSHRRDQASEGRFYIFDACKGSDKVRFTMPSDVVDHIDSQVRGNSFLRSQAFDAMTRAWLTPANIEYFKAP